MNDLVDAARQTLRRRPSSLSNRPAVRGATALLASSIGVIVLHLVRLDLLLLVLPPVVVALVLPMVATLLVRLMVAVGLCFVGNVVGAWLAELVHLPFTPVVAAAIVLVPAAIAIGAGWWRPMVGAIADAGDAIAVLAGIVVLVLLWLPTARDSSAAILARLVSDGEDNAAHLGILQAIVIQHGLLLGQASRWSGRLLAGHTAYPPAFHLNGALLVAAIHNLLGSSSPALLVRVYFALVIGLQAIWAATTVLAARALARLPRTSALALAPIALAIVLLFLYGPPTELMNFGFQSQVAALWMLTLELFLATAPGLDLHPVLRLSMVLAAMVGTSWSWYLVSPVAGVAALLVTAMDRDRLIARWPITVTVWVMALVLSAPPLVYGVMIGAPGYINATGGVFFLDRVLIGVLVIAGLGALLLPATRRRWVLVVVGTLIASGIMALAIHWYQTHTAGAAKYFYEKVLYTVPSVAAVAAGGAALYGVQMTMAALSSRWRQVGFALGLAALAWLSTGTATDANPGRNYLTGIRMFPDVGAMQFLLTRPAPHDGRQVLFWSDTPLENDYLSSRFAAGIYLRNSDARNDFMAGSVNGQDDRKLLSLLRASPDGLWLISRNPDLATELHYAGFTNADMNHLIIDTVTEPPGSGQRPINVDISPRGWFAAIFRQR